MSISFELGEPPTRTYYTGGSPVRGLANAAVSPHIINQLKSVDLVFSGRSEVQLRTSNNQNGTVMFPGNGRTMFFEHVTTLAAFDPYHPATPGGYTFAFDLKFPSLTTIDQFYREMPMAETVLCKLPAQSGMPLPPTFRQSKTFSANRLGSVGYVGEVRVIYELEVQLNSIHGRVLHRGAIQLRYLPQSLAPPPRMTFVRRDKLMEVKSAKLNVNPASGSLKGWAKGVASKTPISKFKVFLDVPNFCTVGSNLPIYMGVDYDLDNSTATDIPSVYLVSFFMKLTHVLRIGTADKMYSTDENVSLVSVPGMDDSTVFANITGDGSAKTSRECKHILLTERTDLRNHTVPDAFLIREQSFETTNIHRCFQTVTAEVAVECAGKRLQAHFHCSREVIMRPPDGESGPAELDHAAAVLPNEAPGGIGSQIYEAGGAQAMFELQGQIRAELPGGGINTATGQDAAWKQFELQRLRPNTQNPHEEYYELE